MHAPPKFTCPPSFYTVLFCRPSGFGRGWSDWLQVEQPFCETLDGVREAVGELLMHDGAQGIAVIHSQPSGCYDATDDALTIIAHERAAAADGYADVPELLRPYAPEWVREDAAKAYERAYHVEAAE